MNVCMYVCVCVYVQLCAFTCVYVPWWMGNASLHLKMNGKDFCYHLLQGKKLSQISKGFLLLLHSKEFSSLRKRENSCKIYSLMYLMVSSRELDADWLMLHYCWAVFTLHLCLAIRIAVSSSLALFFNPHNFRLDLSPPPFLYLYISMVSLWKSSFLVNCSVIQI